MVEFRKCCKCGVSYVFVDQLVAHLRHRHTAYDKIRRRIRLNYERRGVARFNAHPLARMEAREKIGDEMVSLMKNCGLDCAYQNNSPDPNS